MVAAGREVGLLAVLAEVDGGTTDLGFTGMWAEALRLAGVGTGKRSHLHAQQVGGVHAKHRGYQQA